MAIHIDNSLFLGLSLLFLLLLPQFHLLFIFLIMSIGDFINDLPNRLLRDIRKIFISVSELLQNPIMIGIITFIIFSSLLEQLDQV